MEIMKSIWLEYDNENIRMNNEIDSREILLGLERYPAPKFKREMMVFKNHHFGRIVKPSSKTELPTGSILHIIDNITNTEGNYKDVPDLDNDTWYQRESFRKYLTHIKEPKLDGPATLDIRYLYKVAGLPASLMGYRRDHGKDMKFANSIAELPIANNYLNIINHNPIFRIRVLGAMKYFNKMQLIFTHLVNSVEEATSQNKQQFIEIPWSDRIYDRSLFLRTKERLNITTVKEPNDFRYLFLMHLINFVDGNATTSIFSKMSEKARKQLTFIISLNGSYVMYNLEDLLNTIIGRHNDPDTGEEIRPISQSEKIARKVLNHINLLVLTNRKEMTDEKLQDAFEISTERTSEELSTEQEVTKEDIDETDITEVKTYEIRNIGKNTTDDLDDEDDDGLDTDKLVDDFIKVNNEEKEPLIREVKANPFALKPKTPVDISVDDPKEVVTDSQKGIVKKASVPGKLIRRLAKDEKTNIDFPSGSSVKNIMDEYVAEIDKAAALTIENNAKLTPKQKDRLHQLSGRYKTLQLNGTNIEDLLSQSTDVSLTEDTLSDKIGYLPDKSALKSSITKFDKTYLEKAYHRNLAGTLMSFQKNGVFLIGVKEEKAITRLNNFNTYSFQFEDMDGKKSTIKMKIPTVDYHGRMRIDGKTQVLKKQRINLPIVKISEDTVSLTSNYNKARIIRNSNKAHNFFSFIDSFINNPEKSDALIEYGNCKVNALLPYEYSTIAERYRYINFKDDKGKNWSLCFDFHLRHDEYLKAKGDDKKFDELESMYGTYLGTNGSDYYFIDNNNRVYEIHYNYSESISEEHTSIWDIVKKSLKADVNISKQLTEWVDFVYLSKSFPVVVALGYRLGLKNLLDYMGVDYTITEGRSKKILANSKSITSTESNDIHTESYVSNYGNITISNCKWSELNNKERSVIEKMEKELLADQLAYIPDDIKKVWREIGEVSDDRKGTTSRYTVAYDVDGSIMGFASFDVSQRVLWFHRLYVSPKYRRRSIGGFILDAAVVHAKRFHSGSSKLKVFHENKTATNMYFQRGYDISTVEAIAMRDIKLDKLPEYTITKSGKYSTITISGGMFGINVVKNTVATIILDSNFDVSELTKAATVALDLYPSVKMIRMIMGHDCELPAGWVKQSMILQADLKDVDVVFDQLTKHTESYDVHFESAGSKQLDLLRPHHKSQCRKDIEDTYHRLSKIPYGMLDMDEKDITNVSNDGYDSERAAVYGAESFIEGNVPGTCYDSAIAASYLLKKYKPKTIFVRFEDGSTHMVTYVDDDGLFTFVEAALYDRRGLHQVDVRSDPMEYFTEDRRRIISYDPDVDVSGFYKKGYTTHKQLLDCVKEEKYTVPKKYDISISIRTSPQQYNRSVLKRYSDIKKEFIKFTSMMLGIQLDDVNIRIVNGCVNKDYTWNWDIPANVTGGSSDGKSHIFLPPPDRYSIVMDTWKVDYMTLWEFIAHMVAHETSHITWTSFMTTDDQAYVVKNVLPKDFTTVYLDTYMKSSPKYNSEKFCEYMAACFVDYLKLGGCEWNAKNVKHLKSIDSLKLSTDEYVIGASAAAVFYGYPSVNEDVDIVVNPSTLTRLIDKGLVKQGNQDGIHDNLHQSLDGNCDISTIGSGHINWPEHGWFKYSIVIEGYRILSWVGLYVFYSELYGKFGKAKHKIKLDWMMKIDPELKNKTSDIDVYNESMGITLSKLLKLPIVGSLSNTRFGLFGMFDSDKRNDELYLDKILDELPQSASYGNKLNQRDIERKLITTLNRIKKPYEVIYTYDTFISEWNKYCDGPPPDRDLILEYMGAPGMCWVGDDIEREVHIAVRENQGDEYQWSKLAINWVGKIRYNIPIIVDMMLSIDATEETIMQYIALVVNHERAHSVQKNMPANKYQDTEDMRYHEHISERDANACGYMAMRIYRDTGVLDTEVYKYRLDKLHTYKSAPMMKFRKDIYDKIMHAIDNIPNQFSHMSRNISPNKNGVDEFLSGYRDDVPLFNVPYSEGDIRNICRSIGHISVGRYCYLRFYPSYGKINVAISSMLTVPTGELHPYDEAYHEQHSDRYLYHLSAIDLGETALLTPRVPDVNSLLEDTKTPRISTASSVEGCIVAHPLLFTSKDGDSYDPSVINRKRMFVYYVDRREIDKKSIVENDKLVKNKTIFDAHVTDECWVIAPTTFKFAGEIEVVDDDEGKLIEYEPIRGPHDTLDTYLFKYKWMTGNDPSTGVRRYIPKRNDIKIVFEDCVLWINRYPLAHSLIFAGLDNYRTSSYPMAAFDDKDVYYQLLMEKKMSINYLKGIDSFFDLFIDNMTYIDLKVMGEPTNVVDLLIRASVMLSSLEHLPASSAANHKIRGYEQLNAIVYNEMSRQFAAYQARRNKANTFSVSPEAIYMRIIKNAAMVPSDAINPLQDLKETCYVTHSGVGGRTSESFVIDDRKFTKSDIGILSEATPDNGKVAINSQLSMDPTINDITGALRSESPANLEPANVLSIHALTFPFSTNDDSKRINFISTQSTHVIPTDTVDRSRVRTGYERTIAHRVGRDYAGVAEMDGKVVDVVENGDVKLVHVLYEDGTKDVFQYGETYAEFQGFHVTHRYECVVKKGQKLTKGDIITYNKGYFNYDPVDKQLDMSIGVLATVAFMEIDDTSEDSASISAELSKKLAMRPTNTRVVAFNNASSTLVHSYVKVGEHVSHTDPLMIFEEDAVGSDNVLSVTDEETLSLLSDLNKSTPAAKFSGKVVKMEAYYGGDLSTVHPSLSKIVKEATKADDFLHKSTQGTKCDTLYPKTDALPEGSKFKGVSFDKDTVIIVYYIQEVINHAAGDKLVLGIQLKCTNADVYDKPASTQSGVPIDAYFSCNAVERRIVDSLVKMGIANRVLEKAGKDVCDIYFGKDKSKATIHTESYGESDMIGDGYFSVEPDADTVKAVNEWASEIGVEVISDLHVTLMYDSDNPVLECTIDPARTYSAESQGYEMMGEPGSKWRSIAVILDSPDLVQRHAELKEIGYTHSYPDFKAHMSLAYCPDDDTVEKIKDNMDELISRISSITLSNEKKEPVKSYD